MAARSPATAALGRSCRMQGARLAGLSPARGDGKPLALAALLSDVAIGDEEVQECAALSTTPTSDDELRSRPTVPFGRAGANGHQLMIMHSDHAAICAIPYRGGCRA
jgi:hypothetical protein